MTQIGYTLHISSIYHMPFDKENHLNVNVQNKLLIFYQMVINERTSIELNKSS